MNKPVTPTTEKPLVNNKKKKLKRVASTKQRARAKAITGSFVELNSLLAKQAIDELEDIFKESTLTLPESFPVLHKEYLQQLSGVYPEFTELQLKICALLKVYCTQAEVSAILDIPFHVLQQEIIDIQHKLLLPLPNMVEQTLQQVHTTT